jgi:hypothetical protein
MPLEPTNHPNANASFWFGIIVALFFTLGFIAAVVTGDWPPVWLVIVSGVLSGIASVVNLKDTFETNDPWKTYFGVAAILITILIFVLPISAHSV